MESGYATKVIWVRISLNSHAYQSLALRDRDMSRRSTAFEYRRGPPMRLMVC
jgi:hypothetical protein